MRRSMQKEEEIRLLILVIGVFVALVLYSGALLLAGLIGIVTTGVVGAVSSRWQAAFYTGAVVAFGVLVLGIMAKASPGWYQGLL